MSSCDGTNTSPKGISCLVQILWRASSLIFEATKSGGFSRTIASSKVSGTGSITSGGKIDMNNPRKIKLGTRAFGLS